MQYSLRVIRWVGRGVIRVTTSGKSWIEWQLGEGNMYKLRRKKEWEKSDHLEEERKDDWNRLRRSNQGHTIFFFFYGNWCQGKGVTKRSGPFILHLAGDCTKTRKRKGSFISPKMAD